MKRPLSVILIEMNPCSLDIVDSQRQEVEDNVFVLLLVPVYVLLVFEKNLIQV